MEEANSKGDHHPALSKSITDYLFFTLINLTFHHYLLPDKIFS